jgi:hypothetical protein
LTTPDGAVCQVGLEEEIHPAAGHAQACAEIRHVLETTRDDDVSVGADRDGHSGQVALDVPQPIDRAGRSQLHHEHVVAGILRLWNPLLGERERP